MKVSSINGTGLYNTRRTQNIGTQKAQSQNHTQTPSFGTLIADARYALADSINNSRKRRQFSEVERIIHNDIEFYAERMNIDYSEASSLFRQIMDKAKIPLKKDGHERGLNSIIGYSVEKYLTLRELVMPLVAKGTPQEEAHPLPNGILYYGPRNAGKTRFVQGLRDHIEYLHAAKFKVASIPRRDTTEDNPTTLVDIFDEAEYFHNMTGETQVIFFDDLDETFENCPNIKDVFLALTKNCAERGIVWVAAVNDPHLLPDILYRDTRLSAAISINNVSKKEKSAVMSYWWKEYDREDRTDHERLLSNVSNKYFTFRPPETSKIAQRTNAFLESHTDRPSHLHKHVEMRAPVTDDVVIQEVQKFIKPDLEMEKNLSKYDADLRQEYSDGGVERFVHDKIVEMKVKDLI